ncbi:MAG: GNAT family N-acetyltransferase [Pseudomonadota bacterium]
MTDMASVRIVARPPDAETFRQFRAALGWGEMTLAQAERAVGAAHYDVVAMRGEEIIGFGRVTGDGVVNFHLDDVIVKDSCRGQGVGQQIVAALLRWIDEVAIPEAMISLTASAGMEPFYERFGFSISPPEGYGHGMMRLLDNASD